MSRSRKSRANGDDPPRDDPAPEDTTPAAPSFINTAVSEGQVLLSWFNPSDDSITGYQISRGPDADSLVVIEDDTGSSSTSYTDTAPPGRADPHLRREGPQRLRAGDSWHGHRDRADGRSPHRRKA